MEVAVQKQPKDECSPPSTSLSLERLPDFVFGYNRRIKKSKTQFSQSFLKEKE